MRTWQVWDNWKDLSEACHRYSGVRLRTLLRLFKWRASQVEVWLTKKGEMTRKHHRVLQNQTDVLRPDESGQTLTGRIRAVARPARCNQT
jgi:hypothetical protein